MGQGVSKVVASGERVYFGGEYRASNSAAILLSIVNEACVSVSVA